MAEPKPHMDKLTVSTTVNFLRRIDSLLIQLDFDPDDLASDHTRGFWYAGIAIMGMAVIGFALLNVIAFA